MQEIPDHRSPGSRVRLVLKIIEGLIAQHPRRLTGLTFSNSYELLVATVLSSQCTDSRVNSVTKALFEEAPDPHALAELPKAHLETLIQTTGLHRRKAGLLIKMANMILKRFDGKIPKTIDQLIELPGVGRKTASVVLAQAYAMPAFPVDRHVARVAHRLDLVISEQPIEIEKELTNLLPRPQWIQASDSLIQHGRKVCRPRPICHRCNVNNLCSYPLS